jgi:hypothetical protein
MKGAAVMPAAVISVCRFASLAESLAKSAIRNPSAPNVRAIDVPTRANTRDDDDWLHRIRMRAVEKDPKLPRDLFSRPPSLVLFR